MIAPEQAGRADPTSFEIVPPVAADGVEMWRLADESRTLDVNSRYAYVLWCRDFAVSSVIARRVGDGRAVGFVTGYRPPEGPDTLFIWQVCVDPVARGAGLAGRMLDAVWDRTAAATGVVRMRTTITPDNESSIRLFTSFATRHDTTIERSDLFGPDLLGDDHEPEDLYSIGPITAPSTTAADTRG